MKVLPGGCLKYVHFTCESFCISLPLLGVSVGGVHVCLIGSGHHLWGMDSPSPTNYIVPS